MSERVMETRTPLPSPAAPPPLENGDHLDATEFLRRYEAMPEVRKAELIQGIVHMGSPVRADFHGAPDGLIQGWLFHYTARYPDTLSLVNSTMKLGIKDVPQPDAMLFRDRDRGGRAFIDKDGYLKGVPELIVEIAASRVSKDAREKLDSYRSAGVGEYLLWRVQDGEIDWFVLEDDAYRKIESVDGILESQTFPGLWLDVAAALAGNRAAVLETLERGLVKSGS